MEIVLVIAPFVVLGIGVLFVAFAGGAGAAREMYLTRGGKLFTFTIVVLYLLLGVIVPAAVIASRGEAEGGVGALRSESLTTADEHGKTLFIQNCKTCHTLAAVQADRRHRPESRRAGRARQGARAERDRERRHRPGPHAGEDPPG